MAHIIHDTRRTGFHGCQISFTVTVCDMTPLALYVGRLSLRTERSRRRNALSAAFFHLPSTHPPPYLPSTTTTTAVLLGMYSGFLYRRRILAR